ncbi:MULTISPECIES: DUF4352 domain-containing protein [unclassified Kitasatospora]|uniref:DUF4352 domain-containing protein n=1 Tax=unclassified Kitasatospora TaxID=2633591 RepID=UPI000710B632|nr:MULTISPECIES: DUF4352 domain-containing protein [unclassified Kitasatospora]KQV23972.1 hypothetical protein ASC99_01830 [Kitasatospora sp. Root107]KRB67315.1 hypothetical protein ASE03_02905 [Kitasatospora sp. Root187]
MAIATTTRRRAALLLTAGLVVLGATACTDTKPSVSTEAKPAATASADGSKAADPGKSAEGAKAAAKLGDTIALKGNLADTTADVTAVKLVDNAEGVDEFSKPADGKRFVAIQFRIKATGKGYNDSPSNSAKLIDAQGQAFNTSLDDTKAGPSFAAGTTIAAGESGLGFLTFEVPADAKLDKVQFTLDSGFAPQTGQWKLG